MRVDLLCSGSKGNACLVRSKGHTLLIDCGSTKRHLTKAFEEAGACFGDVNTLLVTHGHSDHISQLKHFAHCQTFSHCELNAQRHDVKPGTTFTAGPFSITVIGLSHDAPNTVGYVIRDGSTKFVYITDTGYVQESVREILANADAYVFESNHDVQMLLGCSRPMFVKQRILSDSGHLCNEDSARNLAKLVGPATKHIILAHISQEGNTKELALNAFYKGFSDRKIPTEGLDVRAAGQFETETFEIG